MNAYASFALACALAFAASFTHSAPATQDSKNKAIELGNFSVSLAVKDMDASRKFYEKLDFKKIGGNQKQNWLILQNGTTTIGLFKGMFPKNVMTFNPGWDKDQKTLKSFQDVRELQTILKKRGIKPITEAKEGSSGPAHFILVDPDGNSIFVDQHVDKPKKSKRKKK